LHLPNTTNRIPQPVTSASACIELQLHRSALIAIVPLTHQRSGAGQAIEGLRAALADRKEGVFVGRQFYIRDPDGTVIELTEWDGTSRLD
jgi:hypothetical protein